MRSLTTIEGQSRAESFVAYLLTQNISTHVEPTDGSQSKWEVWIRDEDRMQQALAELRDFEANLELTYSAQLVPGWTFQPVATYIWHPSGDASRDATVVGARTFLRY